MGRLSEYSEEDQDIITGRRSRTNTVVEVSHVSDIYRIRQSDIRSELNKLLQLYNEVLITGKYKDAVP
jgi:hypothetical protein